MLQENDALPQATEPPCSVRTFFGYKLDELTLQIARFEYSAKI